MSETPKPRLTWKKDNNQWNHPATHSFGNSDGWIAKVQQLKDGRWFWYGAGCNTCDNPTTLEQAKADAKAHVLSALGRHRSTTKTLP